jgi:tetratricopeptide (TPR) repeat protein
MPMTRDLSGLDVSTTSAAGTAALDAVLVAYLRQSLDLPLRLGALLALEPDAAFGHALKAALTLTGFKRADRPAAAAALARAETLAAHAHARERLHVQAIGRWLAGDIAAAIRGWEQVLEDWPADLVAYRLHHFLCFWTGQPERMLAAAQRCAPAWDDAWPVRLALLACQAFAHEECGLYVAAEHYGRRAVVADVGEPWGAHAVAHVLQMQGRVEEGIDWLRALEPHWHDRNAIRHHLGWHRALYHLARGEHDEVLALYDTRFRNLASPLTSANPDLYIDVQNAVSMLWRLGQAGANVGARWHELADHAEARIGDGLSTFTVPHWMMALVACGRWDACVRMIEGLQAFAARAEAGTLAPVLDGVGLPLCRAILAAGRERPGEACDLLRPIVGSLFMLGGSHAQQDLFTQFYADCARRAGREADLRLLRERAAGLGRVVGRWE